KQNGNQPAPVEQSGGEQGAVEQQPGPPMQQVTAGMVSTPVIVEAFVPDPGPELEALRAELDAALTREVELREEAHAACRAAAEREVELEAWSRELESRSQSLESRAAELERDQAAQVERHTEIVAEYARVQELSSHAAGRVEELEEVEQQRAEA